MQERYHDARAAAADGVTDRDGRAVDVADILVDPQLAYAGNGLGGKGLIELDEAKASLSSMRP